MASARQDFSRACRTMNTRMITSRLAGDLAPGSKFRLRTSQATHSRPVKEASWWHAVRTCCGDTGTTKRKLRSPSEMASFGLEASAIQPEVDFFICLTRKKKQPAQ